MKKLEMTSEQLIQAIRNAKTKPKGEGFRMVELMELIGTRTPELGRRYVGKLIQAGFLRLGTRIHTRIDGVEASVRTYVPTGIAKPKGFYRGLKRASRKRSRRFRASGEDVKHTHT